jgi:AcrR family transcriptional regulator
MKQGIRNVKMDDIAMEAGISKRTLYEMFGDKENLLLECLRQHARNSEMELRRITNRAKNPVEVYVYAMERRGKVLQNISTAFITESLKYESVRQFLEADKAENRARARDFFMDGIEKGYFRSDVKLEILFTFGEIMSQFVIEKQLFES